MPQWCESSGRWFKHTKPHVYACHSLMNWIKMCGRLKALSVSELKAPLYSTPLSFSEFDFLGWKKNIV